MLAYTVFLLVLSLSIFNLEDSSAKGYTQPAEYCIDHCTDGEYFICSYLCV